MKNLTLIIPAKNESESLPIFLRELSNLDLNILVVLSKSDIKTIDSIKNFKTAEIFFKIAKVMVTQLLKVLINL